jgi:hypothetical protein
VVSPGCNKKENVGAGQKADNYTKRKNKIMNTEIIANEIKTKIAEGAKMLESLPLRMEICDIIERNRYIEDSRLLQELQKTPEKLMTELTKSFMNIWPAPPASGFVAIEELLKPLYDIAAILDRERLEGSVRFETDSCRMKDARMPWQDFKKVLLQRIFTRSAGALTAA